MYYLKKAIGFIITIILVSLITFLSFQILPGNPARAILGVNADDTQIANLEKELNLDKTPATRYFIWIKNALHGNLGKSYKYRKSVSSLIGNSFSVTASLALYALFLSVIFGIPVGIFLARKKNSFISPCVSVFTQVWISTPNFCTAILLIIIFTVKLELLPSMGFVSWNENPLECIRSLTLPAISLALGNGAVLARYMRASTMQQEKQDYIRTAKSKGLTETQIVFNHLLKNALIPVITALGMMMSEILGGSIIIENVFSLPGIGKLITTSINTRDFPLIQGLVLYLSFITVICNFIVDTLYSVIDPRIRRKSTSRKRRNFLE